MVERRAIPTPGIEQVLVGDVAGPITTESRKPATKGQNVAVHLVQEGSGQFGLTNLQDNKEWSGIFHHSILTARVSGYLAEQIADRGYDVDPTSVVDAMVVSHTGRRQWDEANWYPDAVTDAQERSGVTNETLGLRIIQGKVPEKVFDIVSALAHGNKEFEVSDSTKNSLDYRLAVYVDHRTTDHVQELHNRLGDFLAGFFYARNAVDPVKREEIRANIKDIIDRQKQGDMDIETADQIAAGLGASEDSSRLGRKEFMGLVLTDADTEQFLESNGIDTTSLNDSAVPMPDWETDMRLRYVAAAKDDIVARIDETDEQTIEREFPKDTWWGLAARVIYIAEKTYPEPVKDHFPKHRRA
jgi:hypothetical protein